MSDRDVAAGSRFREEVDRARREADIGTWAELYRRSGVSSSTWNTWFQGRARPNRTTLEQAVRPLPRTAEQLLASYDGQVIRRKASAPQPLDVAVGHLERIATALERLLDEGVQALPPQRREADRQALEAWGGVERRRVETQQPAPKAAPRRRRS